MKLHKILSRKSVALDWLGQKALRYWLYRENLSFNPDANGEHKFLDLLNNHGFNPSVVVDIGANEGRWSARVKRTFPSAVVHLFEPVPSVCSELRKQFDNVYEVAVSDKAGKVRLVEQEQSSHSSIVIEDGDTSMIAGADLLSQIGEGHIDLLKIDTEGFDLKILMSLGPILPKISFIQFEHHALTASYGVAFHEATRFLESYGFTIGKIFPDGIRKRAHGRVRWADLVGPNFVAFGPDQQIRYTQFEAR